MDTYSLTATNASDESEDDSLAVSFGNDSSDSYVAIQRFVDGHSIYIVFDDQANGDYDKITSVQLTQSEIDIRLSAPIGHYGSYSRISIALQIPVDRFVAIANRMQQIFADTDVAFSRS